MPEARVSGGKPESSEPQLGDLPRCQVVCRDCRCYELVLDAGSALTLGQHGAPLR